MIDILEKKHAILVAEFDRYVIEHPEFADKIPRNAQVVLQVEGDREYKAHAFLRQPSSISRI